VGTCGPKCIVGLLGWIVSGWTVTTVSPHPPSTTIPTTTSSTQATSTSALPISTKSTTSVWSPTSYHEAQMLATFVLVAIIYSGAHNINPSCSSELCTAFESFFESLTSVLEQHSLSPGPPVWFPIGFLVRSAWIGPWVSRICALRRHDLLLRLCRALDQLGQHSLILCLLDLQVPEIRKTAVEFWGQ